MYCGASLSDSDISSETKERMKEEDSKRTSTSGTSVKAFGAFLIIIGILADVISMFLIASSDFSFFNAITIGGTISFLIGLAIVSNS